MIFCSKLTGNCRIITLFVNTKFCFKRKQNNVIYEINLSQENNNYRSSKFEYKNLCYKRHHLPQPWPTVLFNFDQSLKKTQHRKVKKKLDVF